MFNLLAVNVSAIVDIVALIILALFAFNGFRRGFVKTFLSVFGTILALLFSVLLASKVSLFLENKFSLVNTISNGLSGTFNSIFGEKLMNTTLEQATSGYLTEAGVGSWLIDIILSVKNDSSIPTNTTLNQIICPTFAYYITLIISVVILFIIFKLIFFLIGELAKKLHAITLIAVLDKSLGVLLGLISGIITLELFIMIIGIIPLSFCNDLYVSITNSAFAGFIHKINLFNIIMQSLASADITGFIKSFISKI